MEVRFTVLYYDQSKKRRAIFSIRSADLLGRRMYITPCSAMLGTEKGRIVDGVTGLPDRVMKYA